MIHSSHAIAEMAARGGVQRRTTDGME